MLQKLARLGVVFEVVRYTTPVVLDHALGFPRILDYINPSAVLVTLW